MFCEGDLKAAQTQSCEFPWPSCTPVQVVAGAGRDAMVLLKSQMAAKALLPTSATKIAFGCPRFSLGLSISKILHFFPLLALTAALVLPENPDYTIGPAHNLVL